MGDPRDFWIHVTNIVLGRSVLFFLLGTLLATVVEIAANLRRRFELRAELDHDLRNLAHLTGHK